MSISMKQEAIAQKREYIKKTEETLNNLAELISKLKTHTGKIVDKRFFVEHFKVSNEYRDWTKYQITPRKYEWSKNPYNLFVTTSCTLELMSRETVHIIAVAEEQEQISKDSIARLNAEIESLQAFDEESLIEEIQALYVKYGKPETWGKVLDSYDVKYPSKD